MSNLEKVKHWSNLTKVVFVIQGLLLLSVGIKDVITYKCTSDADVQCTRLVNVTWLVIGFAVIHFISGVFSFFISCESTIYQPVICFVLWSMCTCSLVFYHVMKLYYIEKNLSTNLAVTLAIVMVYVLVMLLELLGHVVLIRIQNRSSTYTIKKYKQII